MFVCDLLLIMLYLLESVIARKMTFLSKPFSTWLPRYASLKTIEKKSFKYALSYAKPVGICFKYESSDTDINNLFS